MSDFLIEFESIAENQIHVAHRSLQEPLTNDATPSFIVTRDSRYFYYQKANTEPPQWFRAELNTERESVVLIWQRITFGTVSSYPMGVRPSEIKDLIERKLLDDPKNIIQSLQEKKKAFSAVPRQSTKRGSNAHAISDHYTGPLTNRNQQSFINTLIENSDLETFSTDREALLLFVNPFHIDQYVFYEDKNQWPTISAAYDYACWLLSQKLNIQHWNDRPPLPPEIGDISVGQLHAHVFDDTNDKFTLLRFIYQIYNDCKNNPTGVDHFDLHCASLDLLKKLEHILKDEETNPLQKYIKDDLFVILGESSNTRYLRFLSLLNEYIQPKIKLLEELKTKLVTDSKIDIDVLKFCHDSDVDIALLRSLTPNVLAAICIIPGYLNAKYLSAILSSLPSHEWVNFLQKTDILLRLPNILKFSEDPFAIADFFNLLAFEDWGKAVQLPLVFNEITKAFHTKNFLVRNLSHVRNIESFVFFPYFLPIFAQVINDINICRNMIFFLKNNALLFLDNAYIKPQVQLLIEQGNLQEIGCFLPVRDRTVFLLCYFRHLDHQKIIKDHTDIKFLCAYLLEEDFKQFIESEVAKNKIITLCNSTLRLTYLIYHLVENQPQYDALPLLATFINQDKLNRALEFLKSGIVDFDGKLKEKTEAYFHIANYAIQHPSEDFFAPNELMVIPDRYFIPVLIKFDPAGWDNFLALQSVSNSLKKSIDSFPKFIDSLSLFSDEKIRLQFLKLKLVAPKLIENKIVGTQDELKKILLQFTEASRWELLGNDTLFRSLFIKLVQMNQIDQLSQLLKLETAHPDQIKDVYFAMKAAYDLSNHQAPRSSYEYCRRPFHRPPAPDPLFITLKEKMLGSQIEITPRKRDTCRIC